MARSEKVVRQSISLPLRVARQVRAMAKSRKMSSSRVVRDLIERGIESQLSERERFLILTEALVQTKNPSERKRLKEELAKLVFGH